MPYMVSRVKPRKEKVDLIDFLNGLVTMNMLQPPTVFQTTGTRTAYYERLHTDYLFKVRIDEQIKALNDLYDRSKHLIVDGNPNYNYELQVALTSKLKGQYPSEDELQQAVANELEAHGYTYCEIYRTFYLPKKSSKPGHTKWRRIDAPCDELANVLRTVKIMFEALMDGCTYHTSAFAYVPKRSAADAVKKHANNKSNWYLKIDFSNFFGSITPEFAYKMLSEVYPFSEFARRDGGREAIQNILRLAFLNSGLPQGTPLSPLLTNIIMVAIDHNISNGLRDMSVQSPNSEHKYDYVYTRYADDIVISNRMMFNHQEVLRFVTRILQSYGAPMRINNEKTRFASNAGANWMLGVMLNQDYDVTVGHKRKKQLKAALTNYAMDRRSGSLWSLEDLQHLQGEMSYCRQIERDTIDGIVSKYNQKYGFDIDCCIKLDMKRY